MDIPSFIRKSAEYIRIETEPREIILFGSYAKGRADVRSDVDFLVIGDFDTGGFDRSAVCKELTLMFPVGFDLHFVSIAEIAADLQIPGSFYHSAMQSGQVLYKRKSLCDSA